MERFDVAVVGAGVSGAAVARRLSQYEISVALLEREADVSFGTSKANSGIIHGGFHHSRRYLKARLEIRGADMYPQLHRDLGFPYKQCGIVVAAFSREQQVTVEHLYRQGVENGSPGIELCGADRVRSLEPKLHPDVIGGLYAPAGGIIEPYRFVFSLVENAQANGLSAVTDFDVVSGSRKDDGYLITGADGRRVWARYVVNAAGLYADAVSKAFGAEEYAIVPRKGEYHLLDRRTTASPERVVFPVPTTVSKGMLVIPTVEGTVLLGPTADEIDDKEDRATDAKSMQEIVRSAQQLIPSVSEQDIITSFAGLRPTLEGGDFFIEESKKSPGFIHVAGIQSPGLTAAPAVGEYVKDLLKQAGCRLTEKASYHSTAPEVRRTRAKSDEEIAADWSDDPDAGTIVCRCESVTRQDVVNAVRAGHTTVDGVKFYSRATAGRCQGGFCLPRILAIISEETGMPVTEITKRGGTSAIVDSTLPGTDPFPAPAVVSSSHGVDGSVDTLILGGGAAGMAAAGEIASAGHAPLVIDREERLGGVLRQCVHNGFGIHEFNSELTGPEYAERYVDEVADREVPVLTGSTVLSVGPGPEGFVARVLSRERGLEHIHARSVALAMGSRERNRGSIRIPGSRPSGVLTAGSAQRLVNIDGYVPGKRAVIIGSGDIGLIMARRMKFIGADVEAVIEIQPVPSGLNRNIVQCLDDFGIPLYLGHVVTGIHGRERVTGVTVAPLENGVPNDAAAFSLSCDTVLLSVGLIPENELSRNLGVRLHAQTGGPVVDSRLMTSIDGVFAAGNVLHIHDVVDYVAEESRRMGQAVVSYLQSKEKPPEIPISAGSNVRYVMPGKVSRTGANRLYLRSFIAKVGAVVEIRAGGTVIKKRKHHHVQPSEMISIDLAGDDLDPATESLEVAVV